VELKLAKFSVRMPRKIIFDLSGVTILDSTALEFCGCQRKIQQGRSALHIAGVSGFVEETLKITSVNGRREAAAGF